MRSAKRAVKKVSHQGQKQFLRIKCLFTGFANGASTAPVIWLRCLPEGTEWEPFLTDDRGELRLDDDGLECAATDGHRLAVLRLANITESPPATAVEPVEGEPFAVTVPARSLRELERILSGRGSQEPLSLFCERGQVVVLSADQVLTSRSLDGTYPNYRQLIPPSFQRRLVLDRRAFIAALERVAVLADQHTNVVKISADPAAGTATIQADAQDVGSGSESLAATIEGDAIEIAFNVRYLLDGLKAMGSDQVVLQCNAPTTPAVLAPVGADEAFTYLVMPVQIRTS
jgi:DNA polymerase-3 subunit beta